MGEVDYQLALLLQHQFEQELKKSRECNSDLQLAKALQEQFQKEVETEQPKQNLVYNEHKIRNPTKSLTDPSWEVVDPTPDIHVLFMVFNERFFWKKLLAVCVSWSKRMTSCAGVCSYQGRGGLCSITLSEPLLKLRPRKDLVETLLHEMIHAFLFVTHNNRDRDGHGPEFHKHMHRINADAGTNITVYHDFHDEVRLYQQHWWRCDGPCQKWKPYFGMVRRAMNRAPGPQDRWWGEHSRNCGGNFIKVKEPEKPQKKSAKSSAKENKKPKEDIRNFIPSSSKNNSIKLIPSSSTGLSNVHTVTSNNNNGSKISTVIPSKANNIFGFTNLNGGSNNRSTNVPNNGKIRGAVRNNSNTIVINKTQNISKVDNTQNSPQKKQNVTAKDINGKDVTGKTLSEKVITNKFNSTDLNLVVSTVRNHWVNKFSNGSTGSTKRKSSDNSSNNQKKVPKLCITPNSINTTKNSVEEQAECPICMQQVTLISLSEHVDKCLQAPAKDQEKECIICTKKVSPFEYERHVRICTEENLNDDVFETSRESEYVKCSFCGQSVSSKSYDNHLTTCVRDFVNNMDEPMHDIIDLTCDNVEEKLCAGCDRMVSVSSYDTHVEKCLLQMYDDMEANYNSSGKDIVESPRKEENVSCLACGKNILKSELGLHLEDCMSLSRVFEDDNEPKEEVPTVCDKLEKKYNCPFCMKLVPEIEMKSHIDICLDIKGCSSQSDKDKCRLIDSFFSCDEF